jgi:hypothetical protein
MKTFTHTIQIEYTCCHFILCNWASILHTLIFFQKCSFFFDKINSWYMYASIAQDRRWYLLSRVLWGSYCAS